MPELLLSDTTQAVLRYFSAIAPAVYFLAAKTTAACFLQQPRKGAGLKLRRYLAIVLSLAVVTTVAAEGISTISKSFREPQVWIPQDYIVHLILLFAVHTSLTLGLIENSTPIWYPYLGAWCLALVLEVPIVARQAVTGSALYGFEERAFVLSCLRTSFLLALSITSGYFSLTGRNKSVKLDDETEALFANGDDESATVHGNNARSLKADSTSRSTNTSDDDDEDDENDPFGFDSDSEEPSQDKELRKQQRQRLRASGSWLNYLKEYKIFIPMIWPSGQRMIQACLVLIGLCMIAELALNILVPRQLGIVINDLTRLAGTGVVPWKSLGLWMFYSALRSRAGIDLVKSIAQIPVEQWTYKAVSTVAFRHIMGLSMNFHSDKNSGELIRAIDQGTNLESLLNFVFFEVSPVFVDLIVAFIYVYILFDIYMSLILGTVGVLYVWIGAKTTVWNIQNRRNFNNAWRLESKVQNEAINNWQTVSHFNRSNYESERYEGTMQKYVNAAWSYFMSSHISAGAQSFVMLVGRLTATLLAVYRVSQGRAPIGNLVTLLTYWSSIEGPLSIVSYSIRRITQMLTDSERLLQLLQTKATVTDAPDAKELEITNGEVIFEGVGFSYDVRKPILNDVSFVVKPGQTVALVGETGGGKTTMLKLLYRYYDVSNGIIRIDGQDIREVTLDSLRESFGMVPQDPSLFNISIMDNIRYARLDATDEEVHAACAAAAIHDKILSFPDGYKSMVGERGVKLSGGELQRVAIARAILRQPKIVLLDEATSMIDAETESTIQTAFKRLTAGRTTFIVAHRLSTIQHADMILVIGEGGILERGTHDDLLKLNGRYVKLWSRQLSKEMELARVGEEGGLLD